MLETAIDLLCTTSFKVTYNSEKFEEGFPYDLYYQEWNGGYLWSFRDEKEYWDFDIEVGSIHIDNISSKIEDGNNPWATHIRSLYAQFLESLSNVKSNCVHLNLERELNEVLIKLRSFQARFGGIKLPSEEGLILASFVFHDDFTYEINDEAKHKYPNFLKFVVSQYFKVQKEHVELAITELSNVLSSLSNIDAKEMKSAQPTGLKWEANDTDLLELIVALRETSSLRYNGEIPSRKELVAIFEEMFDVELKDYESKLTRATERKKDTSPYLGKLKKAFDDYCNRKDESK